jgi:tetratricopeptide (TPR) repeat protein/TolB-like protein
MQNARRSRPQRFHADDTDTSVDQSATLVPGTRVAGRYRILERLGVGGMGIVYKAWDDTLDVAIALKVLRPELGTDPDSLERFRKELLLGREVTHKNVVRIHDIGESQGMRFITMRLIEGRSLLEVLEQDGPIPVERALGLCRQVAEALAQAHDAGVVHRDLKPGNILLSDDDTAYVTDFGVARCLSQGRSTHSGVVVGTLDYLSPEQAAGLPVDHRSDIYALGIVLFEMLTGELPFRADTRAGSLVQHITGRTRDITETGVRVPPRVRRVLRRCLERSPTRRYATTREMLVDLDDRRPRLRDRLPRPATLAVAAAVLVGGAALAHRPWLGRAGVSTVARVPTPVEVAVLPLADDTGEASLAWTSSGIAEMLTAQLADAPSLRVVDSARVQRTVRDLKLDRAGEDEATLRRLAELLEVSRLVVGHVRRAGPTVRVDLRLLSLNAGRPPASRTIGAEAATPGGLFRVVADLGGQLRRELDASPAPDAPPAEPPTASLEAAQAYREGRERLLIGDAVRAAPAFERAVAADSRFVEALLGLAEAWGTLGHQDKAVGAADRAGAALVSKDTRLAWRVHARQALLRGEPAEAEKAYAELARRYPHDTEALLDLAGAQTAQGALTRAIESLRRVTEADRADPRGWFLLGKNLILAGDARQAVSDPLVRALALMTQLGNEQGQGDVLNAMGVAHHRLGEFAQALARYGEAAVVRQRIGDERGAAMSLRNRASIHLAQTRLDEAEPDLRAARAAYQKIGDRKGLAEVWNDFGALEEGRGQYAAAREAYQAALRIRRELGDEQQLAQSYDNVGYAFFVEGEHDNALVYWRQALDLRKKIGDKGGVVLSTQNLGFLEIAQGRWREAMKSFLEALQSAREIEFTNALAVSHGNIGLLHQYEGRYDAALPAFREALGILKGLDDKRGLAEFTIKEASALIEMGRLDEARPQLEAASGWVRETGNHEQAADLQVALGDWHLARGEADRARSAYAQAVELAGSSHSRGAILRARISRAAAAAPAEGATPARELAAAVREADTLGDVLLRIRALEALARAELARGRRGPAEESARRALKDAERCGWGAGLPRLHALLDKIRGPANVTSS